MRFSVVTIAVAACGGNSDPPLTCAALEEVVQCIGEKATAFAACIPMRTTTAVMSADQMNCSWSDGTNVAFDHPPAEYLMYDSLPLKLTVTAADGSTCGVLESIFNVNQTLLDVSGAEFDDESFDQKMDTYCGSARHSYSTDYAQDPCSTSLPSFAVSLSPTKLATFTLKTTTTSGVLFKCQ